MFLLDLLAISITALVFTAVLFGYYQPKINDAKEAYKNFNGKLKDKLMEMDATERQAFLSRLPKETRQTFKDILNGSSSFSGIHQFYDIQENIRNAHVLQDVEDMNNFQFQQFTQWAMDEGFKRSKGTLRVPLLPFLF
jgi:hypothetical protein